MRTPPDSTERLVGRLVEVTVGRGRQSTMTCTCRVMDVDSRNRFGHARVLVTPVRGTGETWVDSSSYTLTKKAKK